MKALSSAVTLALFAPIVGAEETYTPGVPFPGTYENFAAEFLDQNCIDCHDDATTKGDLSLENLGPIDETNAAVWKSVWAQVSLHEMPPKKKDQPEMVDRLRFSDWIVGELQRVMKDKGGFSEHLDPKRGNFLNHDLLFGELPEGIRLVPTSSPARIWRVTTHEHMTRMNELINTEPKYDPAKPGLRTQGDDVPTNHGGELKLYFGTDRIIKWQGGTVAYATAVKSIPAVFSSSHNIGFENYADFNSVNSAEATQVLAMAEDILRYMAYGPLSIAKPEQITDDPNSYKMVGDIRGLPSSIVYSTKVVRPLTPIYELMKQPEITDKRLRAAVEYLFEALTFRPPTTAETDDYVRITKDSIAKVGREDGAFMGLSSIFLNRDALFRPELAEGGKPDEFGRVMLQDWELGLAVNHALRFIKPDEELRDAIVNGRMRTREDVRREVTRMLGDDSIRKPQILRFFREYFDYDLAGYICKDDKALAASGAPGKEHYLAMFDATASDDRLIELILAEDKNVLKELLTTQQIVATNTDKTYFGRKRSRDEISVVQKAQREAAKKEAEQDAIKLQLLEEEIAGLEANPKDKKARTALARKKKALAQARKNIADAKKKKKRGGSPAVAPAELKGPPIYARVSHPSFGLGSMKPERILATSARRPATRDPDPSLMAGLPVRCHGQPRHPPWQMDPRAPARRRHPRCPDHRERHAARRAGQNPARADAGHPGEILLDLP